MAHPAVAALAVWSVLAGLMALHSAWWAGRILLGWNPQSGDDGQLQLERRTSLVASVLGIGLTFQVLSVFLFIFTAEQLHGRFVGAMCAAGTLHVNGFGYPALALKLANCFLGGLWLVMNRADTLGYDYPLIRVKYRLLLVLAPLLLLGEGLQVAYLSGLKADVITSCCGSLFGQEGKGLVSELTSLPWRTALAALLGTTLLTAGSGFRFLRTGRSGYLFAAAGAAGVMVAGIALVSVVNLYIYELPTHHCPFCMLKPEYGFVGYFFYLLLLTGGVASLGLGATLRFRSTPSLGAVLPRMQRRLAITTFVTSLGFLLLSVGVIASSNLRLE